MKTANESLHFSPISLCVAKRNAACQMANKCAVLLLGPSELNMHERSHSKKQACCVTLSFFPNMLHTDADVRHAPQKGTVWLDLT